MWVCADFAWQNAIFGLWCCSYEPRCPVQGRLFSQICCSLLSIAYGLPFSRRSFAAQRSLLAERLAENHGFSAPIHFGEMRHGGKGGREPVPVMPPALETKALSFWIRRARDGLSILQGSVQNDKAFEIGRAHV